jgi:hypothetical protein
MASSMRAIAGSVLCFALGLGLLSVAGGCSSGPAKVDISGTITKDGKPLKVGKQGEVEVKFWREGVPEGERITSKYAQADPDTGHYEIKGIPVGKYKVSIKQIDPRPANDLLDGTYDRNNSKIYRDVEKNEQVIDIDLAKEPK